MLVLSRKLNQEIVIGDNVKVTVLKVKGNTVRLGVEAPRNIRVVRGELPPKPEYREIEFELEDAEAKIEAEEAPLDSMSEAEEISKLQREATAMTGEDGHVDQSSANITVVFDNSSVESSTSREESDHHVIPFSRAAATESKTRKFSANRTKFANSASNTATTSVSFQGQVPEALKRNRLKEIVAQLTNK